MTRGVAQREATAVAVDSTDRVFVFNRGNLPIIVFDADGNCLNTWGNATPGRGTETITSSGTTQPTINRWIGSEFMRPHAITIDHEDNLWLVDDDANVITNSTMLKGYCQNGDSHTGFLISDQMKKDTKLKPDANRGEADESHQHGSGSEEPTHHRGPRS